MANSVSSAANKVLGKTSQKNSAQSSNSSKGNAIVGTPPQSSNTKKGIQQDKAVQAIIDGALKGQSNVASIASGILQNLVEGTDILGTILDMYVKSLSVANRKFCTEAFERASLKKRKWRQKSLGYNRADAVRFALTYAVFDNKDEAEEYGGRFGNDCTAFVSRCLSAGGLKMTSEWNFIIGVEYYRHWDSEDTPKGWYVASPLSVYTKTWSLANEQYNWIINSSYINQNPIVLDPQNPNSIKEAIANNNIREGDILYFRRVKDGMVSHASFIVAVTTDNLIYAQHSTDKIDGSLKAALGSDYYSEFIVVRIRN